MELVTGRKGVAHITSQQDRMKHQGMFGDGAYILKTGQMLEPQVQTSNEIRIRNGALMVQGALSCVKTNSYDAVTIQNGTQGMKRIDLICWQYTYDAEQDVESAEWVVIQGAPAESDPQQPSYTNGDIQQGDSPVQVPVFAVELDGINVTGVTTLLPTAPTLEELNSKMPQVRQDTRVINGIGLNYAPLLYLKDIQEMFGDDSIEVLDVTVVSTNGEWGSSPHIIYGTSWQESQLLIHMDSNLGTGLPIRVNSIIMIN